MNEKAGIFTPEEMQIRQADESDSDALALLLAGFGYPTETSPARERLIDGNRAGDSVLIAVYNSKVAEGVLALHRICASLFALWLRNLKMKIRAR